MQRSLEVRFGASDDWSDRRGKFPARTDTKTSHGIAELAQEGRILVDVAHDDREAGGTALLTGVTKCRLDDVANGHFDVGACTDED
jgi:siroheme synthase (precorrin-2 oxidase/ferrochelatase)